VAAQTYPGSLVALPGNHPNELSSLHPAGRANPAARLALQLTLALRNRGALQQLLRDQQDPASPNYHRWLTPAQFTARFGPSPHDLDAVSQWLGEQGFKITDANLAGRYVRFSATVADAQRAFATNIMTFGDGASSYANVTDPLIPARLSGIISSVSGLDNFLHTVPASVSPAGAATNAPEATRMPVLLDPGQALPENVARAIPGVRIGSVISFGPSDFRSFYDENPLIAGGVTGAGDCIAIVGTSNFMASAVNTFNSTFGLPASSITTVLTDSADPGLNGAQDEAYLDLEWSHAVAPGAATRFYLGNDATASPNGSIVDSIQAAVNQNLCSVISVSYALCGGSAGFFSGVVHPIYAQAAAQGQSTFIVSGDWGAAGLVFDSATHSCVVASSRTPNELGTDPNVTNVGGTAFSPNYDGFGNNVGNVPESAWNDSIAHPGGGATGGGQSGVFGKPAYQMGPGVPNDGVRDIPDVSIMASPYSPGAFWGTVNIFGAPFINCCIGGTSLSAPVWAGIAKLLGQLNGGRTGPLNPRIYALANAGSATSGFRDVTVGNNNFAGLTGFSAGPGYDLTTGWGTVDISTFANHYVSPPAPVILGMSAVIEAGASFNISGSFFSPGALINFFVATATGPVNAGPLKPSSYSPTFLTVPVPATVPLGTGFASVQVVNADLGFKASNTASALLQGSAAAGIPTITSIDGVGLAATSSDPRYATNNVQTVVTQGTSVTIGGRGFDTINGVAVLVFCACPGGRMPTILIGPGGFSSTSIVFILPAATPTGPLSLLVVNAGPGGGYSKSSNAVSVVAGARLTVTSVSQSGGTITVKGFGFSTLTVINLFNTQLGGVVNLGGFAAPGVPRIPLTVSSSTMFAFSRPTSAQSGASYVQAFNPPYVPYTSSGTGPGGAFSLF
jgi:pseudomonalisin